MEPSRIHYYIRHLNVVSATTESDAVAEDANKAIALFEQSLEQYNLSGEYYVAIDEAHAEEVAAHYAELLEASWASHISLASEALALYKATV